MAVPTPKPSIGAPDGDELVDLVLVEAAAREDLDAGEAGLIERVSDSQGEVEQVAGVEAHGPDLEVLAEFFRKSMTFSTPASVS